MIVDNVMMSLTVEDYIDYLNCFDDSVNRFVENGVVYIAVG